MCKNEKWIKLSGTALCEIFVIFTVFTLLTGGEADRLALAVGTIFLVLLPMLVEKLFRCRICLSIYLFSLAYAIGPMLGHCWKLYYTIPVWDKLLHISGGVMFAILGAYFFDLLAKGKDLPLARTIFALCFSIAAAVIWEFFEFGADIFLGMDMQDDTMVYGLSSYLLGDTLGVIGNITNIQSVTVNGIELPGYIDIGLLDTMLDMLLETVSAVVTSICLWLGRGKLSLIQNKNYIYKAKVNVR